jgi:exonuclease III
MKRLLPVVLVAVAFVCQSSAEDRRTDRSKLVVMTFNALFMFDGIEPEEGSVHDIPWRGSQTEAEEHMQEIAGVIIASNPDIVSLAEVENLNALETLNSKFLMGRGYRSYLVDGTDSATGQDVGLLTRIDPVGGAIARDNRQGESGNVKKSVSKNYVARFDADGLKFGLIGLHFLAQPLSEDRKLPRQAQADAIGQIALELQEDGFAPIVLGDYNDYDGVVLDLNSNTPISNVLARVKRMSASDNSDDLINVASLVPQADRFTSFFDRNQDNDVDAPGELTSIDHILVAPSLFSRITSVNMPHTLDPTEVSDHFPIVVTFNMNGMGGGTTGGGTGGGAGGGAGGGLRIARLLPNPDGNENEREEATIRNGTSEAVNLNGYTLRDRAGQTWGLSGTIAAGQSRMFKRNGQAMAMNNNGDTIDLIEPDGDVIDSVTYGPVDELDEVLH